MKLYGFPPTRSIRVVWMLRELDVEFEFVTVDPTKGELRQPEFLALNPAGKLPVLVDGDAWSDHLPGSKDIQADWVKLKCGNYNSKTKACSGQNYK